MKAKEGIDFVTCKICGKSFKKLVGHLPYAHNINTKEYKERYPNSLTLCKNSSDKQSKGAIEYFSNPKYAESVTTRNANISKANTGVKTTKATKKLIGKKSKEVWASSGYKDKMSKTQSSVVTKLWENPKYRKSHVDAAIELCKKDNYPAVNRFKRYKVNIQDKIIYFRSQQEIDLAKILSTFNVEFLYEPFKIKLASGHYYMPDFYIPTLNLIIEMKGDHWYKEEHKIECFKAVINKGYNFLFILESDFHANTEPSFTGNSKEGVETRSERLKQHLVDMSSKTHETLQSYLI